MAIQVRKSKKKGVRYLVKVRDRSGRWFTAETFDRKVDAERRERELLNLRDHGTVATTNVERQMTVSDLWDRWSLECRGDVSDGWKLSQDQMARDFILPSLGTVLMTDVRPQDICRTLALMAASGKSAQTRLHVYNVLHKMMGDASEHFELNLVNPVKSRYRPEVRLKERAFLTPDESRKMLTASKHTWLGPTIWISILSGLRPSEIQALRWGSVEFQTRRILIREAYMRKTRVIQPYPKGKDTGVGMMPKELADYLLTLRAGKADSDFVCPGTGGGMLNYESLLKVLRRLCEKLGIKRVTPHELRHSCTELYVEQGAGAEDIRRLLNQKSLSATSRYIHRTDQRLQGIADLISTKPKPGPSPLPPQGSPNLRLIPGGAVDSDVNKMSTNHENDASASLKSSDRII